MTLEFETRPLRPERVPPWQRLAARRDVRLDPALRPAFLASGDAQRQIDRLFEDGALCVTTGQQPGLLTGPLYTIYKAVSAVAFARDAERALGRPVVPVFWVAGDDHDFAEANHVQMLDAAHEVRRLVLRERDPAAPLTPLSREPVGPEIAAVLAEARDLLPGTEFAADVFAWLERHYRPDATLAAAFAGALAELFEPEGLVVFDPTHPAAKRVQAPWLIRALELAGDLDRALAQRARGLEAAGAGIPVPVGDGATTVMLEGALGRDRLVGDGDGYATRRAGERWSLARLRELAGHAPERLSANVLLRPVTEAAILPTLAYLAGPSELAYLPQCDPIYDRLGVAPQATVGRWSARVIEGHIRKVLDKYGIAAADLDRPEGQLEAALLRDDLPAAGREALSALEASIRQHYARLADAAGGVDPTLRKPIESARNAALAGVADAEKRILTHLKRRNEVLVAQLAKARANLFPLGRPQERAVTVTPFLVRYGRAFIPAALAAAEAHVRALEPAPAMP